MRASVLIAAHNEGESLWKTIRACVESIAGLEYELIVADDASDDGSVEEALHRFPQVRLARHPERLGASPTKHRAALEASGEVLVFLDGHTNPEYGAIQRLVEDVEQSNGNAIVTPAVPHLDAVRWLNSRTQVGHGYALELEALTSHWIPLKDMRTCTMGGRRFHESPALIGCAMAISRPLYQELAGFDPDMLFWGVEDIDFGLKSWLLGHPLLHDPQAVIGHRFRQTFDQYTVPNEQVVVNQLRMARKHFTSVVWDHWVEACRQRNSGPLAGHPEGLWARAWELFEERRASVEQERHYLHSRRLHDEFWYAERFGLMWPRLERRIESPEPKDSAARPRSAEEAAPATPQASVVAPLSKTAFATASETFSPSPSPSPPPDDTVPADPCESCDKPSPDTCPTCEDDPPTAPKSSSRPVRYLNGEVELSVVDLASNGFGATWNHSRTYSNRLSADADFGQGYNWLVFSWPYLVSDVTTGLITVVRGTRSALWFDLTEEGYQGRYGTKSTLALDDARHVFVLTFPDGTRTEFNDFSQTTAPPGLFSRQVSPGGDVTAVFSYTTDGLIEEIRRSGIVNGSLLTEAFVYEYTDQSLTSVRLRRQLGTSDWNDVRRAVYDYYAEDSVFGSLRDLQRTRIQVPTEAGWADEAITYYRYYVAEESHGFVHGLKFVVLPATYAKMIAAAVDPMTASNAVVSTYADLYFEYDPQQRVTQELVDGASRSYGFEYIPGTESVNYNVWGMKTVETLPDGNQTIVYTNLLGQVLIREQRSGTDRWIDAYHYDLRAHQVWHAHPSAVLDYDDSAPDLAIQLRPADGLIEVTDYYTGSSNGAAPGYIAARKLQRGTGGTPVTLQTFQYASHTSSDVTVYYVSHETTYRNTDGSGASTTVASNTFYSGTTQVQQRVITLPVVPTDQNGSGQAATRKSYFDKTDRETWSMDERGFITHSVYNLATGALVQRIDDVNTNLVSGAPTGWTTPVGGGLNLVTDIESDDQGRTTQVLGPPHTIDLNGTATLIRRAQWTVYDDVNHAVYTGSGFAAGSGASTTFTLINPVAITQQDAARKVLEQMQAVASTTAGTLAEIMAAAGSGAAAFPQTSYTRWSTYQYTDCCLAASQRVYHTIPDSGAGAPGTNYDETDFGYDVMKRRNRTVTPGGTITELVFDPRGFVLATYVGTNDDGATEHDPSGGGASASNDMVIVTANELDHGSSGGDGNITERNGFASASDTRVTAFAYDWRNRRTTTDGEIDFFEDVAYDNLDRVVRTDRRDTTAAGNLVARSETRFDNVGRTYQTLRYGVDPATGTVGNALIDNTWYDAAGNVIKSLPAGSKLFTKTTYDGLGRPTARYTGYDLDEVEYPG